MSDDKYEEYNYEQDKFTGHGGKQTNDAAKVQVRRALITIEVSASQRCEMSDFVG